MHLDAAIFAALNASAVMFRIRRSSISTGPPCCGTLFVYANTSCEASDVGSSFVSGNVAPYCTTIAPERIDSYADGVSALCRPKSLIDLGGVLCII
jgi:hypothetical protein